MKPNKSLIRQSHFLGTKIRNLRKRNNLTIEDLSTRCIHVDAEYAPSVSYLSMIERGKRVPSADMLAVIGKVFEKEIAWFLDDTPEDTAITPNKGSRGGLSGMALEPSFLFSQDILQIAIPELLSQTGTSSRQFAHLLIRAHQEHHQNHFPDLEKAAESIGKKNINLSTEDLLSFLKQLDININWFDQLPQEVVDETGALTNSLMSSYFEPPKTLFLNNCLKQLPARLKYELATHIGHIVLHQPSNMTAGESHKTIMSVGGGQSHRIEFQNSQVKNRSVNPQDIVQAWRDFESSFFAGALLCPRVPFRQLLERQGYEINIHQQLGISASVAMRRMTAVSNYKYWHYFDAYSPGKLKAVYRGNGIPLPWGNMRQIDSPCQHWAVFRAMQTPMEGTSAQLSIMEVGEESRIYCCESVRVNDIANNPHVLCAGIDLNPALEAQGKDAQSIANELKSICVDRGGEAEIKPSIKQELMSVARILNINWIKRGIEKQARLICSQGKECPRKPSCY